MKSANVVDKKKNVEEETKKARKIYLVDNGKS
jgi:hypothetical protein